ncbi:methionyl-tRNA formyltransferase [Ensifer aridi]|uniref:methionyl-tRNA formyltransferase n=1 Tax=Ensifer aridi TaxID=1708715 RepID=UPI000478F2BA|nr:formyltransferase family protein [Ensifer aridi]
MFRPEAILYVGTRKLAARCLEYLVAEVGRERIAGVMTISHGTKGWWSFENYPEVWEVAEQNDLPLIAANELPKLHYDLMLSILWGKIFPQEIISKPPFGAINLHPAPLPKYRGLLTRTHAIANCEKSYGVSMHYMVPLVDQGDLLAVKEFPILPDDTALSLDRRAMDYGFPLFCETWQRLCDGSAQRIPQENVSLHGPDAPRTYTMNSIGELVRRPDRPLSAAEADRLRRALHFPPTLRAPDWLNDQEYAKRPGAHSINTIPDCGAPDD